MKLEVSLGEAIDKYSILELKLKKINDTNKQVEIKKELDALTECVIYKDSHLFYYNLLFYINERIWDMTNEIKSKTTEDSQFSIISNKIFEYNQKRFRIKNWFNLLCDSSLKEQKSYASTGCKLIIQNEETIYNKIAEIHYIALNYDNILIETPYIETFKRIFNIPTFTYETVESNNDIVLESYEITEPINKEYFELPPINYLGGGMFGDFIQSLSVINETFYKTGKKGNIYISNKGDVFRYGLENTYNDTYDMLMKQKYINNYLIYNNHHINIDLTTWRDDLFNVLDNNAICNWNHIYNKKYNVDWGSHKWLETPINDKFKDTIFINTTSYRWGSINFNLLYSKYGNNIIFIGSDIDQYNDFINKTKVNIPFYLCNTFTELCISINSCKLFVGGLSGPLTLAHACHKDRIIALPDSPYDSKLNSNFSNIWKNVYYNCI